MIGHPVRPAGALHTPPLLQRGRHEEPASSPATPQANNLGGRSLFCPGRRGAPGARCCCCASSTSTTAAVSFGNDEFGSIPVSASSGCRARLGPKRHRPKLPLCPLPPLNLWGLPLCNCMYVMVVPHCMLVLLGVEEMLLLLASGRLRIIYKNLWPFQIRLFICFFTDIRSFVLNKDPV